MTIKTFRQTPEKDNKWTNRQQTPQRTPERQKGHKKDKKDNTWTK